MPSRPLDATYYLDVPEAVRTERLLARARQTYGERGDAWVDTVDRPNSVLVESTRHRADFVVGYFDVDGEPPAPAAATDDGAMSRREFDLQP